MKDKSDEYTKRFQVRVPKTIWKELRRESFDKEMSMNGVIVNILKNNYKKIEKELTE